MAEALAGVRAPGAQRVEAVAPLPGGSGSFLVRAGGDQGGVHVDDHPARQRLPGDRPATGTRRGCPRSASTRAPGPLARARAIRSSMAGVPARSRARRDRRPARRVPEHRGQVRQQGDVAHAGGARARSRPPATRARCPGRSRGDVPFFRSAPHSQPVSPAWSAALRSRTAPAWPTRPGPVRGDLQGMVPPVMLHGEERSSSGDYKVVVTRNLPGPGRSSLLKPAGDGRFAAVPFAFP